MNLKTIALTTIALFAAIVSPAAAIDLAGSRMVIGDGAARFSDAQGDLTLLDFAEFNTLDDPGVGSGIIVSPSQGVFAGFLGASVTVRDLVLRATGPDQWVLNSAPVENFVTGNLGGDDFSFSLTAFTLERLVGPTSTSYYAALDGVFNYQGSLYDAIEGDFVTLNINRFDSGVGTGYLIGATAVPTPALLPGLVGFGLAAWRRRRAAMKG